MDITVFVDMSAVWHISMHWNFSFWHILTCWMKSCRMKDLNVLWCARMRDLNALKCARIRDLNNLKCARMKDLNALTYVKLQTYLQIPFCPLTANVNKQQNAWNNHFSLGTIRGFLGGAWAHLGSASSPCEERPLEDDVSMSPAASSNSLANGDSQAFPPEPPQSTTAGLTPSHGFFTGT